MKCETAVLQNEIELARFTDILKAENVRSYLEVGSKFGGSLWRVANALPKGSRIVSVDLPWGDKSTQPHLEACISALDAKGYDVHLILGDSTASDVIGMAAFCGPYDSCLIDSNHTEPYVRKDWATYGPMARIVAFHDIGWEPRPQPTGKMPIDVKKVWDEIKGGYRYEEIRECVRDNGIGVLWRH